MTPPLNASTPGPSPTVSAAIPTRSPAALPTLVRIPTHDLRHARSGQPSLPLHGNTRYRTLESFSALAGQLSSGVWEATAGAFRSDTTGYVEFCHILEGSCRVVDPDGTAHAFAAGDSFVLPEGFLGHWEVDERVKKVYFVARTEGVKQTDATSN